MTQPCLSCSRPTANAHTCDACEQAAEERQLQAGHKTTVYRMGVVGRGGAASNPVYFAECSCGWTAEASHYYRGDAEDAALEHLEEVMPTGV